MFVIKLEIVWFFIFIHVSYSERRIEGGIDVKTEKKYVVYFVKAPQSMSGYDYWLCGGALVTTEFVVTSAACIKDVDYLYVIAGYKKYVVDNEIESDACTSKMKKKVIFTCYPDGYELKYERLDKWSLIDIGVARVESPYDFEDPSFQSLCSYTPGAIAIGYDAKHQEPNTDAVVFGWGHTLEWRKVDDTKNYNQETLKYAPVMIIDKEECKNQYEDYGNMNYVIDTYMICTLGAGKMDETGDRINSVEAENLQDGCIKRKSWAATTPGETIDYCDKYGGTEYDETRREIYESNPSMTKIRNINNINKTRAETNTTTQSKRTNRTALTKTSTSIKSRPALIKRTTLTNRTVSFKKTFMSNKIGIFNETSRDARKNGICQNDHGGPLVTWMGTHEVLIGVASVFKVAEDLKCTGPFLYTSTQCNGAFLDCILSKSKFDLMDGRELRASDTHRRSFCTKSKDDKRHPTMERHISWLSHPAGPADHEKHLKNPEIKQPDVKKRGRNEEIVNESEGSKNLVNSKYPPNQWYLINKNSSVNLDQAPNRFKINDVQNAPNIGENNAPNKNYGATLQHGPVRPVMTNDKYTPNKSPDSNNSPVQESMKMFELSYKPNIIYKQAQKNGPSPTEPAKNNRPSTNYWPILNNKNEAPKKI